MNPYQRARDGIIRWQYGRAVKALSTLPPERIAAAGERRLLKAFHRAAKNVPAYRLFLAERGVDVPRIRTLKAFQREVPFLDKETVFPANEIRDLCAGGSLDDAAAFFSSSGHSGVFSFGVESRKAAPDNALGLEFLLDNALHIFHRRTLLVNCLPMGVKVSTRTLPVAETSVREDVIHALIRKLSNDFRQFLLVGESPFLKKVIEEGEEKGVPWKSLVVHVITGAEYIAENYRTYLADLLGIDFGAPDRGIIAANMGLSELTLSIFSEDAQTIRIRRAAMEDPVFRKALTGEEGRVLPLVMQHYPGQTFLETIPDGEGRSELVVSTIDPSQMLPLIRYRTGDRVAALPYDRLAVLLKEFGKGDLLPRFRLPLYLAWGKNQWLDLGDGTRISPDQVKEALYEDPRVARRVTGNFRLTKRDGGAELLLQLRSDDPEPPADLPETLGKILGAYTEAPVRITPMPHRRFPHGMAHDYERKMRYI